MNTRAKKKWQLPEGKSIVREYLEEKLAQSEYAAARCKLGARIDPTGSMQKSYVHWLAMVSAYKWALSNLTAVPPGRRKKQPTE